MSKIRLFESRSVSEADRLAGLHLETVSTVSRAHPWRRKHPHAEAAPVLIWIARGQGRIAWNSRLRGYGGATLIVLPAGTPFWIEPGHGTDCTLARLPALFEAPMPDRPLRLRLSDIAVQGELAGLLDRLSRAGDLRVPAQARAALGRIILISALIERETHREEPDHATAATRLSARYAAAVEASLGSTTTVEALAGGLGVTPAHLTRTVKATCGFSALDYRQARVMHAARLRLLDTNDTAASIALDLGFSSTAYFNRVFATAAGQPPGAFRRAARQAARARVTAGPAKA